MPQKTTDATETKLDHRSFIFIVVIEGEGIDWLENAFNYWVRKWAVELDLGVKIEYGVMQSEILE